MTDEQKPEKETLKENTVPNDTVVTAVFGHIKIIDVETGEIILDRRV